MKVLFINPILRTSESDTIPAVESLRDCLGYTFAKSFQDEGHEVVLFAAEDYRPVKEETYPFQVIFCRTWFRWFFKPRSMPFMPGLVRHLLDHGHEYDLIVASEVFSLHALAPALLFPRKLVVWHELALHPRMFRQYASRLWYLATAPIFSRVAVIVPRSDRSRRFVAWRFPNVSSHTVGHGVDLDRFRPQARQDHFVVCSQLVARKNIDYTIERFARYCKRYPRRQESLFIVGDGECRTELQAQAQATGLGDRIQFLGRLSHEQLAPLLGSARALMVASRRDNSLLTLSEALACGTPVITHMAVDNSEQIRKLGLGVAKDDWDEDDLFEVSEHNDLYVERCLANRHRFSSRALAAEIVRLWKERAQDRRPRVAIVSQNCFAQCDIPMLPALGKAFDLRWRVFHPATDTVGYTEDEIHNAAEAAGVETVAMRFEHRLRSLWTIHGFLRLLLSIRWWNPDLVYVNATGYPWLAPVVRILFPRRKVLWAIHDVQEHGDSARNRFAGYYKRLVGRLFQRFHLLSANQRRLFALRHPDRDAFLAAHPPLDFGPTRVSPPPDRVRFLFFGYVAPHKGVDLLVEAFQRLWEAGERGFEVVIAGKPDAGINPAEGLRAPGPFHFDLRVIPTSEVPDLFGSAHWLVLPYRHATQSGPLSLAFRYGTPPIVSDLEAFLEFVEPDTTGMAFQSGNVQSLVECLRRAVRMPPHQYATLRDAWTAMAAQRQSVQACSDAYVAMFRDAMAPFTPRSVLAQASSASDPRQA